MNTTNANLSGTKERGIPGRRTFFRKLAVITGSLGFTLPSISFHEIFQGKTKAVSPDNQDIAEKYIEYQVKKGKMRAFLARPQVGDKFPAVVVIHENRGLTPHIQDVTRRMAQEGFLSLAPDALSPVGGTPEDGSKAVELIRQLDSNETTGNFVAAVKYLKTHPNSTGRVGCTGFCWGGAMTNQVAVNEPGLDAAVPYYGRQPAPEEVDRIKAPVMAHYAENDPGINAGIEAFEDALRKNNKEYVIHIYPGTGHGFNNDTNPGRYNEDAATLSWQRTIGFFRAKLTSGDR
jgi:carboxymethylenebutenolidase